MTRADRIRAHTSAHPGQLFTLRQLCDAVDPKCKITTFGGSVSSLVRLGDLERVGAGFGRVKFRHAAAPAAAAAPAKPTPPAAPKQRTPPPPADHVRNSITGLAKAPKRKTTTGPLTPKPQRTNFTAAPGTVSVGFCPKRNASAQIAADIAAFEAGGGRVEKLGLTLLFRPRRRPQRLANG